MGVTNEDRARFRIAVLAPLRARAEYAGSQDDSVRLAVADPFRSGGPPLTFEVAIADLSSFRLDAIVSQVAPLRGLVEALTLLSTPRRDGHDIKASLEQTLGFAHWAEAVAALVPAAKTAMPTKAAGPVQSAGVIDDLLAQVDTGASDAKAIQASRNPEIASAISSLIRDIARGNSSPRPMGSTPAHVRVEQAFNALLSSILDHPEFHRLERAWRGAHLLRTEARDGVEAHFIAFRPGDLSSALSEVVARANELAPDMLVADIDFPKDAEAGEELAAAGELAERLRAPLVVGGSIELLTQLDDSVQAPNLRELANETWASWVTIAVNGGLVRAPINPDTSRLRDVRFTQREDAPSARVFASAAYLVATLCARSFRELGWASAITGPESGVYGDLQVHQVGSGSSGYALATERLVSTEATTKHARRGLLVLGSVPNRDQAVCLAAPTLAAGTTNGGAPTLADQLFASRIASITETLADAIPAGTDPRTAEQVVAVTFAELFPRQGERVPVVGVTVRADHLEITVRPRRFGGTTMGEFSLAIPLGG